MTEAFYRSGQFVWSHYPERENPACPGPRHIGYVALSTNTEGAGLVVLAYTTSQPWAGSRPLGVFSFDSNSAAGMGQARPFTLDLRRMAFVPATVEWFPDLPLPGRGVVGQAPESLRVELEGTASAIARRRPELIERLGPLRPGGRR